MHSLRLSPPRLTMALATFALAIFAMLASLAPARAADTPASPTPDVTITISNFAFTPAEVKVPAGTKVIFLNSDDAVHSVIADDASFQSDALDSGDQFSFTFAKAGVFSYHCGLHPFMQGKITVE